MNSLGSGLRFGRWTVGEKAREGGRPKYNCICDCGTSRSVLLRALVGGISRSCGCARLEDAAKRLTTHGMSTTKGYLAWQGMLNRCRNKNMDCYHRYGGRGISVCDRWAESYTAFLSDMGERPEGMTIDRINTNGNYEPGNCRWATRLAQSRNKAAQGGVQHRGRSFVACINTNTKSNMYLGSFDNYLDAICARKSAENKYWNKPIEQKRSAGYE